jgi:hypothetical protein
VKQTNNKAMTLMGGIGHALFAVYLTVIFWPFAALIRALYLPCWRRCYGRRCLWITTTSNNNNTKASSTTQRYERAHVWPIQRLPVTSSDTIRIVCVSDTHTFQYVDIHHILHCRYLSILHQNSRLVDVPDGDVLIHSGDMLLANKNADANAIATIRDVSFWLSQQSHAHKVIIAGNHDGAVRVLHLHYLSSILSDD